MSELKERFLTVYKETVMRAGSDSLLDWLEHSDFFVAPASTKYHGCYESGLLQHSLNVYDCLKIGIEAAGLQGVYSEETVQNTIDNLQAVNSDIQTTMDEIDTYMQRLNDTRSSLSTTHDKNEKIMQNFAKLLCVD